jgi:chromosome segregation ATPase
MPRKEDRGTHETKAAIARLRDEKSQIRREIRSALSAWQVAKHSLTYATDGEARLHSVGQRLRAKIAAMNGRISDINREIAVHRAAVKERAIRYEAVRDRAAQDRKRERERGPFIDERA